MNRLELYIPKLEEYWYEQRVNEDKDSMSYNAGYDVAYTGYHYDTGCIDFPESRWQEVYDRRVKENRFFAYLKDIDINEFVGYVNYQFNKDENRYECGIVIESIYRGKGYGKEGLNLLINIAKKNGIKEMYDNFEIDRGHTIALFKAVGFKIDTYDTWKKFHKDVEGVIVKITL